MVVVVALSHTRHSVGLLLKKNDVALLVIIMAILDGGVVVVVAFSGTPIVVVKQTLGATPPSRRRALEKWFAEVTRATTPRAHRRLVLFVEQLVVFLARHTPEAAFDAHHASVGLHAHQLVGACHACRTDGTIGARVTQIQCHHATLATVRCTEAFGGAFLAASTARCRCQALLG